jgi:DNA-binding GntR family transcriptional regulator
LAARRAAERIAGRVIDPQQRRAARQALAAGLALNADAPVLAFIPADVTFLTALYRLSGNRVIEGTVAAQWPHLKGSMGAVLDDPEQRPLVWAEHREILRIILVGGRCGRRARGARPYRPRRHRIRSPAHPIVLVNGRRP